MKHKEIEYKYNASDIKLSNFHKFCINKTPLKYLEVSGTDHFYKHPGRPDSFYRHRLSNNESQITLKVLTNDNNVTRDEYNIDAQGLHNSTVGEYVRAHGYSYSGKVYKNCFIYHYDCYCVVYYVCYDDDMQELGRFIEIEMSEDYPWASVEEAQGLLKMKEMSWKDLGIGLANRETRSLFQMFGGGSK